MKASAIKRGQYVARGPGYLAGAARHATFSSGAEQGRRVEEEDRFAKVKRLLSEFDGHQLRVVITSRGVLDIGGDGCGIEPVGLLARFKSANKGLLREYLSTIRPL